MPLGHTVLAEPVLELVDELELVGEFLVDLGIRLIAIAGTYRLWMVMGFRRFQRQGIYGNHPCGGLHRLGDEGPLGNMMQRRDSPFWPNSAMCSP